MSCVPSYIISAGKPRLLNVRTFGKNKENKVLFLFIRPIFLFLTVVPLYLKKKNNNPGEKSIKAKENLKNYQCLNMS